MKKTCERYRRRVDEWDLLDFCAVCQTELYEDCMEDGCCGSTPAASGLGEEEVF